MCYYSVVNAGAGINLQTAIVVHFELFMVDLMVNYGYFDFYTRMPLSIRVEFMGNSGTVQAVIRLF
jgi:hypothetical protein